MTCWDSGVDVFAGGASTGNDERGWCRTLIKRTGRTPLSLQAMLMSVFNSN